MVRRRGAVGFGMVFALVLSAGLFGQQLDKKTDEALKKEAQALSKLADGALAAQGGAERVRRHLGRPGFLERPRGEGIRSLYRHARSDQGSRRQSGAVLAGRAPAPPPDPTKKADNNRRVDPDLGRRHLRRRRYCAESVAAQPLVRRPGRHLRRVRRRERAAGGEAEKRSGAENRRAQADGERPGFLEQRVDDELGHRRRPNRSACQRRSRRRS